MQVLITGALGRVGVMVVEEALAKGYSVRATDLDNPKNRETNMHQRAGRHRAEECRQNRACIHFKLAPPF